ncbi:MAG: pyridoxamine 5'-phosphate oxidase family protein [Methanosarcinales archaeon]|nr:pyridoxamine 5'-phosphate oxidase family protein [Methanosarcinales archaeon]
MKPRELSQERCHDLLSSGRYGRLGLSQDGQPYVVPMSYVFCDGVIYLHSSVSGRKLDVARANPRVCFEVDELGKGRWQSVIVTGTASLSTSPEAKMRMFEAFTASNIGGHGGQAFTREEILGRPMCVWEVKIESVTGREGMW